MTQYDFIKKIPPVGPCVKKDREDRTDVIFIEVEENEIQNSEESIKHTR